MAELLLIASVSVDRMWELDGVLRPGARLHRRGISLRHGGGGMNTGTPLAALGHRVRVAAILHDDAQGQGSRDEMRRRGLDTSLITMMPGESQVTDILVTADGERTLISPPRPTALRPALPRLDADLVYVNAGLLPEATDAALAAHPLVVAQFPYRPLMTHPARVLIASRSDVPDTPALELFDIALVRAGPAFRALVLTDGPRPVTLVERSATVTVPIAAPVAARDTTGAGDVFAAGLIDALVRGETMEGAVRFGNEMAAAFLAG